MIYKGFANAVLIAAPLSVMVAQSVMPTPDVVQGPFLPSFANSRPETPNAAYKPQIVDNSPAAAGQPIPQAGQPMLMPGAPIITPQEALHAPASAVADERLLI